jgi:uncharacterized membrane protein HdeD (DUF308 family)
MGGWKATGTAACLAPFVFIGEHRKEECPMVDELGGSMLARRWWALALRGVVAVIFGILAVLLPGITLASLVLLLAAYLVVDAVLAIISGIRAMRHHQTWWPLLLEGLLDAVVAAVVLARPDLTILALVLLLAVWAIFTGVTALIAAAILPMSHGRILQALSGAISLALGVVMIALPLLGAQALVWWIAAYAVIFGIFQIGLSVQLYRRAHGQAQSPVPQGSTR